MATTLVLRPLIRLHQPDAVAWSEENDVLVCGQKSIFVFVPLFALCGAFL